MIDKRVRNLADAVAGIKDGATILCAGFGGAGLPNELCEAIIEQGARDLTVVANNAGTGRTGLAALLAAGRHQLPLVSMGAIMGGNVRVGLEDSLWIGRGKLAESNADQVSCVRSIIENLSLEVATPDEARAMLALKGGDAVAF